MCVVARQGFANVARPGKKKATSITAAVDSPTRRLPEVTTARDRRGPWERCRVEDRVEDNNVKPDTTRAAGCPHDEDT